MDNTNIHFKNRTYVLLDEMRASVISMDLSYSQTTELLNQILKIEKTVDSIDLSEIEENK